MSYSVGSCNDTGIMQELEGVELVQFAKCKQIKVGVRILFQGPECQNQTKTEQNKISIEC